MKYILIVIMVSFAMCISTACSGLGNKTKKEDNKGMDTAFSLGGTRCIFKKLSHGGALCKSRRRKLW